MRGKRRAEKKWFIKGALRRCDRGPESAQKNHLQEKLSIRGIAERKKKGGFGADLLTTYAGRSTPGGSPFEVQTR